MSFTTNPSDANYSAQDLSEYLYIAYFGRAADPGGLTYWEQQLTFDPARATTDPSYHGPATFHDAAAGFATTPEAEAKYALFGTIANGGTPTNLDITVFLNTVYQDLFNRVVDADGLAYWSGIIHDRLQIADSTARELAIGSIIADIVGGAFASNDAAHLADQAILQNKLAAAEHYTADLQQSGSGNYNGSIPIIASVTGNSATLTAANLASDQVVLGLPVTINLTPGMDHVLGQTNVAGSLTPFFYDGIGPTLNTGDILNNIQNLTITDQYSTGTDIIPAGASLTNITNVTLNTAGNAGIGGFGGQTFDTSGITGVATLTVNTSGAFTADAVNAAATTDVTVNQNSTNGSAGVQVTGGHDVTVNSHGGDGVVVGSDALGSVPDNAKLPAGNVLVNESGSGDYASVSVLGGHNVTVNVTNVNNNGDVDIGNTWNNTDDSPNGAAANPNGDVVVNDAGNTPEGSTHESGDFGAADITVFGGHNVTVHSVDQWVDIGDPDAVIPSNQPTGNVVVVAHQATTFDNLTTKGHTDNYGGPIDVYGGASVSVTTNTGGAVTIGNDDVPGTLPTGPITLVNTASDLDGAFAIGSYDYPLYGDYILGGTSVTVTEAGGGVWIGEGEDETSETEGSSENPTGPVSVTETKSSHETVSIDGGNGVTVNAMGQDIDIGKGFGTSGAQVINQNSQFTGNAAGSSNWASSVVDYGGTTVTVNTTGGNVRIGGTDANGNLDVPTGNVTITDTFSGSGSASGDSIKVLGGAAVTINVPNSTDGYIQVGAYPELNLAGSGLANGKTAPTGNVSITNGSAGNYGTSSTSVYTNGAAVVTIVGAGETTIADVNSFANSTGSAVGTSLLAAVNLVGVQGDVSIDSNALTTLSITDSAVANPTFVTVGALNGDWSKVPAHALTITLNNDASGTAVKDGSATSVTLLTAGTANDWLDLNASKATALVINNTNALTLGDVTMSSSGPDTVTATGSAALNLGDTGLWGKVTSIDASAATGDVTVELNGDVTTFLGGSGNDTVTVDETFGFNGNASLINGGGGTNTVVLTNTADLYNPIIQPDGPIHNDFTNFQILGFADGAWGNYDVSGFAGVTIAGSSDYLNLLHAGASETLTYTGVPGGDVLWATGSGATVSVTIVDTNGSGANDVGTLTLASNSGGVGGVSITSVGSGAKGTSNEITLTGGAPVIAVSGNEALTLHDHVGDVKSITVDASDTKAVDASDVLVAEAGVTAVGGSGFLTVVGSLGGASGGGGGGGGGAQVQIDNISITQSGGSNNKMVTLTIDGHDITYETTNNNPATTVAGLADAVNVDGTVSSIVTATTAVVNGLDTLVLTGVTDGDAFTASITANSTKFSFAESIIQEPSSGGGGGGGSGEGSGPVDVFTTGAGGGHYTLGTGGQGGADGPGGSETVNLQLSGAVRDTITAPSFGEFGARAVVNGFGFGFSGSTVQGDVLGFGNDAFPADTMALVPNASPFVSDGSSYSISNGVVTLLSAANGLTAAQELADVQGIVAADADAYGPQLAMVQIAGATYVIASPDDTTDAQTVIQLSGVTGLTGFGLASADGVDMAAGASVMVDPDSLYVSLAYNGGSSFVNSTWNDQGYMGDTLSNSAAGLTNTFNFGNWAELDVYSVSAGNVVANLTGPQPELLVKSVDGDFALDKLTWNGALVVDANDGSITIKSLVNSDNSASTIWVTGEGGNSVDIKAITDTALTKIDASHAQDHVTLGDGTALSQTGLTILGGKHGLTVSASGAGDTITSKAGLWSHDTITANGAGDTITLGGSHNDVTANGAGDHITVGNLSSADTIWQDQNIHAHGAGDVITFANTAADGYDIYWSGNLVVDGGGSGPSGIGVNSTVNLASHLVGYGEDWGYAQETVYLTGDFTGATSGGSFNFETLNNVVDIAHNGELGQVGLVFNNVANESWLGSGGNWWDNDQNLWFGSGQVNVASATTLAQALDLAASTAALSQQSGGSGTPAGVMAAKTGVLDWFQFGGDTYVVEAVNNATVAATHTALGTGDEVIKLVGLVDLSNAHMDDSHMLHLGVSV